jgi:excisionase family DNA binding protein
MFKAVKGESLESSHHLLTIQEAAHYTGISTTTLYKWVSQRKIPHIKMGRLVKFDPVKLDEWINQQTVMPMPSRTS